ncbi:hypothetical protein ACJRO7_001137 [Eucalyptus globulus]|uniref:Uncharacterized protein n=1 Tax=Eucalyptus globulus TaxID=34317 RepID=A0ABD3LQ02_EUCGL
MDSGSRKCLWMILFVALALGLTFSPIEARNLATRNPASPAKIRGAPFHFRLLPKGSIVPPSGPSTPPFHFRLLPKGPIAPPSGPSAPPFHFRLLPKGSIVPPSGPSGCSSSSPLPPPILRG